MYGLNVHNYWICNLAFPKQQLLPHTHAQGVKQSVRPLVVIGTKTA